ncbi:sporulation inhibitor of replication protein SirA [Halobacillus salinus]|uniref:Sporulation inhibitor of replication protein SirA n=1 Tax=Halobacillus salinus TaxID=192814 RepID=A0A4Z0H653_9BACI|nr:sporulation inhibitor of replication protein SirA [Halobacillus salinus]TGB04666.1 sporulation inhibitor of replication protein SirA [Halobacillus salinus]
MQMMIFSIRREIAEKYYYKVDLMKRFFLELIQSSQSSPLMKQWLYIAEAFPFSEWLEAHSSKKEEAKERKNKLYHFFDSIDTYGIMNHKNYCCQFQCENLWQAEALVLEPLRKSTHSFYIIETNGEHYGWLSPLAGQRMIL